MYKKIVGIFVVGLFLGASIIITPDMFVKKAKADDLTTGLVGYWSFDEGTGNIAHDSSGYGNEGTVYGGAEWVDGVSGKALSFDGVDNYINCGTGIPSFGGALPFTISAWIEWENDGVVVSRYDNYVEGEYFVKISDNGHIGFHREIPPWSFIGNSAVTKTEWHHIIARYDGNQMTIFLDSINDGSMISGESSSAPATPVIIGADLLYGTPHLSFKGLIDEIRIYNRALSEFEIETLYNMDNPLNQGLVGYWSFDEGSGTIAHDSSGYGNDGSIYGATWTNGVSGDALSFDGIDDYVEIVDANDLDLNKFSIHFWIKAPPRTTGYWGTVLVKGVEYTSENYGAFLGDGIGTDLNKIRYQFTKGGGCCENYKILDSLSDFADNSWHHFIGTYDGSNMKIYRDGILDCSLAMDITPDINDYKLTIGMRLDEYLSNSDFLNGIIDEVRIYNRALSESEIQQLYDQGVENKGNILVYSTTSTEGLYDKTFFDNDLTTILTNSGYSVTITDRITKPQITNSLLEDYDELWFLSSYPSLVAQLSQSEIDIILNFRNQGNGLLIMADHTASDQDYSDDANQISIPLGVTFYGTTDHGPNSAPIEPTFNSYPLFANVNIIAGDLTEGNMNVNNPAQVVATYQGDNLIAVLDDGNGRVVFDVSFTRLWDAGWLGYNWILTGDTPQYVRNIADWLSGSGGGNQPPNTPSYINPENHATDAYLDDCLIWTGGDPDSGDTVTYDIYFGTTSPPPLLVSDFSLTDYQLNTMEPITTYYWKIVAKDNHGATSTGPIWDFTTRCRKPMVTTNDATSIGDTTAMLNGNLDDMGGSSSCEVWFIYGPTTDYGSSTTHQTTIGSFSQSISDLSKSTTYHYRAVAKNNGGTTYGEDKEFTTTWYFIHITDTHLGRGLWTSGNTVDRYEFMLDKIRNLPEKPKFVVITGDLTDLGGWDSREYMDDFFNLADEYLWLKNPFIDYFWCYGNHDLLGDKWGASDDVYYPFTNLILIELNSGGNADYISFNLYIDELIPGIDWRPEGTGLSDSSLNYLRSLLNDQPRHNKIIFMHHPAVIDYEDEDDGWGDGCISDNRENFINYCETISVDLVLTGHLHESKNLYVNDFDKYSGDFLVYLNCITTDESGSYFDGSKISNPHRTMFITTGAAYNFKYRKIEVEDEKIKVYFEDSFSGYHEYSVEDTVKIIMNGPVYGLLDNSVKALDIYDNTTDYNNAYFRLHLYDKNGEHVGLNKNTGTMENNISGALYFNQPVINESSGKFYNWTQNQEIDFFHDENFEYHYKIDVLENIDVTLNREIHDQKQYGNESKLIYSNVIVNKGSTIMIFINNESMNPYILYIDDDNDGIFDRQINPSYFSNNPYIPLKPRGPTHGCINTTYTYSILTNKPNWNQKAYIVMDWGDGNFSNCSGPYDTGDTIELAHLWTKPGLYNIRVKTMNDELRQSNWSEPLIVNILYDLEVPIDIKPGSYPNSINVKSKGKVPVAILTNDTFDASFVDPNTIVFLDASLAHWALEDVDDDGDIDMILQFKTQELNFSMLVDEGDEYPYAYLTGETISGELFFGKDTVRLVGQTSYSMMDWISQHFPILGQLLQRFPFFEKILKQI